VEIIDPEKKAFLDAIKLNPVEITIRLVYADWLDEHGEHDEADRQRKFPQSESWLRKFSFQYVTDFDYLVESADNGVGVCFGDDDGPTAVNDEFWEHLSVYTGKNYPKKHRDETYFRCAC